MKTLDELWKENGEKPGLKVCCKGWEYDEWFCVMGQSPNGDFYGYNEKGSACTCSGNYAKKSWSLYQEPKKRVVMFPSARLILQGSVVNELKQIQELIRRDYRVPRFIEVTMETPEQLLPQHIHLKDVLLPVLKDYEKLLKQRHYLVDVLSMALCPGWIYPYWDNPRKQELIDQIAEAIPEFRWPTVYENKKAQED